MMHRVLGTLGSPDSLATAVMREVDPGAYALQRGYLGQHLLRTLPRRHTPQRKPGQWPLQTAEGE
jgi:hypothetical protein